ncbi:MAG: 3-deoxy-D-manno-octulosonic acid transferase [Muribaculaceae bacterium]|nr:3-deoxy-D-manno-octulosonic acid transferase [Muribaculaceae bacterium]
MRLPSLKEVKGFLSEGVRQLVEQPLYSAGISAYRYGVKVAALRNPKAQKLDEGQKEIWQRLDRCISPCDRYIWVHAASLGEFEQGRPLIEKIRREHPEYKVLLTFFSPSGYEVRKDYKGADCVCYLPFDTPGRVKKFLYKVNPEFAIFVKYEFWRNYLHELWRRQIPVYLVSAVFRPEQSFFKKRSAWYGNWLKWYTEIFVQDERSRQLLASINVKNVEVAGDTRFDRVSDIMASCREIPELESFVGKRGSDNRPPMVIMFGSSWEADEIVYRDWLRKHNEVKAVIAPHEFNAERLRLLKEIVPGATILMSELKANPEAAQGKRILIMDCFGLLSSAYAYADVAYVGGGFGVSIHNINEAAVYGIPVLFGPENSKFIEAQELKALGGGIEVVSSESFSRHADRLLYDVAERKKRGRWAGEYIKDKLGASDKILQKIFPKTKKGS